MPKIAYDKTNFRPKTLALIQKAQEIIREYENNGYSLTLRQLYYQMVARDMIPNEQRAYDRLGRTVSKARMSGLIDWDAIVDRTRSVQRLAHWERPRSIMDSTVRSYRIDKWETQPTRVEVYVEKEALAGVVERPAERFDVPFFSCRGYASQSSLWRAGKRIRSYLTAGQKCVILHLGDHDPSGIDMSRDIGDRLWDFVGSHWGDYHTPEDGEEVLYRSEFEREYLEVRRIALNMDQIQTRQPPPNPAKVTDSRYEDYEQRFGQSSWELDALEPSYLDRLITDQITEIRDDELWENAKAREDDGRERLRTLAKQLDGGSR